MRIVELLIDDELMQDPEVGIDGIALVNRPAHMENWLAFNEVTTKKQPHEYLTDDELNELAEAITVLGEPAEMDGWEIVKVEELPHNNEFVGQIKSDPNKVSGEDTPFGRIRYKYVGPKDGKNRPFCSEMLKKNLVYRIEDIQSLTDRNVNDQFAPYDVFEWRGSYNCRHRWVKLIYAPIDPDKGKAQNRLINKAGSERNLDQTQDIPQQNTTTIAAANNGYDALAESYGFALVDIIDNYPLFTTKEEAVNLANIVGCKGYHTHEVNGVEYYMPCEKHPEKTEMDDAIYDVPQYARDKACKARKYKEENPDNDCGTRVGWTRSAQLCNGDKVSRDIIARMSAFGRHLANAEKQTSYEGNCSLLMVDAWGGKEGIEWASKKLKQIDEEMAIDTTGLPQYTNETGKTITEEFIDPNPCWPGYEAIGTKIKNGKEVPNCVPKTANSIPKLSFNMDDDKMEITGAALVPNKLIVRTSPTGEPYYVYFSEETVKQLSFKFMREKRLDATNIEHSNLKAKDTYVVESWIVSDEMDDKANALGLSYPKGTWVITMKTDDPKVWSDIKTGKYAGFSVEGYFSEKAVFNQEDVLVNQIKLLLNNITDE
jgi:hypothetical protein